MTLFLLDFKLTCPEGKRLGFDGENLADELVVYTDHVEDGSYYLDLEDEAGNRNIIALLKDGTRLHASITREMIGAAGNKLVQIRLCSGEETVKKSNTLSIFAGVSVNASEPFEHLQPSEFEEVERRVSEALQQAADYGVKGDKGDPGEKGDRGERGEKGDTGERGEKGETGSTGPQGERGPEGPQGSKGDTGATGATGPQGVRGGRILRITTDPTPYDTPIGDYQPRNRILKSAVISEAETDDVIPGDTLFRAARYFSVQYVDDTYAYTGYGTLFKGDTGDTGTTYTPAVSSTGVISWTNDGGKQNPQSIDLVAAVLAALPTWTGGAY